MKKVNLEDGNASLKKVLLMMKYDTSKTLTENKVIGETIQEQSGTAMKKGFVAGAASGAAIGLAGGGLGAIPGALVGGVLGSVIAAFGNPKMNEIKKMFDACKTGKSTPTLSAAELDVISDQINTAIDGLGTDEESISDAFKQLPTIPDLCGLIKAYETHGDLFSDLEKDLDRDYEWKQYVVLPLRAAKRKSEEITSQAAEVSTTGSAYEMIKAIEPQATKHTLNGIEGAKIKYANSFSVYLIDPKTNAKRFFGYNLDGKRNGRKGNWKIENGKLSTFGAVTGAGTLKPNRQQFVEGPTKEEVKSGEKLLKLGMKGEFVKELQGILNNIASEQGNSDFFVGKVDGLFGGKTKKGLQNYQISAGLKSDGVLGKDTFALLFRDKDKVISTATGDVKTGTDTQNSSTIADRGVTIPRVSAPTSGVQRAATLPAQNAHVDPQPVLRESLKKNLKTKLVEKTQERENLLIESKITTNRFKLISEGVVIKTDDDKIRFVETVIQETNYLVSQGYNSQAINEGLFSALGGLFGGSFKAVPAVFGEYIAKWLTRTLGVPEGSFIQAAIMALVGNLNIADYDKIFTDCRFASNKIADSLIEGYLIQMQNKMSATSQGATGFIVSALRNAVAENFLQDKEGIVQILQDKIGDFICPKLAKVSSVIADKTEEIKDKAVA